MTTLLSIPLLNLEESFDRLVQLPQPLTLSLVPVPQGCRISLWNRNTLDGCSITIEATPQEVKPEFDKLYARICEEFHKRGTVPPCASTWI